MATDESAAKRRLFLKALRAKMGNVTAACEVIGIQRAVYYRWYRSDKTFREQVQAVQEELLDLAEEKLLELIREKNVAAIIFYLKTKAKDRGYVERSEVASRIDGELIIRVVDPATQAEETVKAGENVKVGGTE